MLSEVNHGLDASHIETTATVMATGEFELHTPHPGAAKLVNGSVYLSVMEAYIVIINRIMAPTIPVADTPCIAIVFAKVFFNSQNHGIHPFLVPLNDGKRMHPGVSAR